MLLGEEEWREQAGAEAGIAWGCEFSQSLLSPSPGGSGPRVPQQSWSPLEAKVQPSVPPPPPPHPRQVIGCGGLVGEGVMMSLRKL